MADDRTETTGLPGSDDASGGSGRRRIIWTVAALAVSLLVAGFLYFRPDTLFTDKKVDEDISADIEDLIDDTAPTLSPTSTASGSTTAPPATAPPATAPPATAPPATAPGPRLLGRGDFVALEHDTTGVAAIVDTGGVRQLVISDLNTSNGPDLRVYLSPKVGNTDDWEGYSEGGIQLGPLKGNVGDQTYEIPAGADLSAQKSVVIWCERFSVGFGVANLA